MIDIGDTRYWPHRDSGKRAQIGLWRPSAFEPRVLRVARRVIIGIGFLARSALLFGLVDDIQWGIKLLVVHPSLLVGCGPRAAHEETRCRAVAPRV